MVRAIEARAERDHLGIEVGDPGRSRPAMALTLLLERPAQVRAPDRERRLDRYYRWVVAHGVEAVIGEDRSDRLVDQQRSGIPGPPSFRKLPDKLGANVVTVCLLAIAPRQSAEAAVASTLLVAQLRDGAC